MKSAGGQILAISVDREEQNLEVVRTGALQFPILSDERAEVIHSFDLVHKHGGPKKSTIAVPAHVLVNKDGTIAWRHRAARIQERPDPTEELAAIKKLAGGS